MSDKTVPVSSISAKNLVDTWQQEVQSSYSLWTSQVNMIRSQLLQPEGTIAFKDLDRSTLLKRLEQAHQGLSVLQTSMFPVSQKGWTLQEILKMKRAEAEFQTIVVGAFPPDRLSEIFGTMSVALVGSGGAAYALYHSVSIAPSIVLWIFGAITLGLTVFFRRGNQVKHLALYHDRLESL